MFGNSEKEKGIERSVVLRKWLRRNSQFV